MSTSIKTVLLSNNLFELLEPVVVSIGQHRIIVPEGYVTDFASLPSVLHWWMRPTDKRVARAAVVHDWLYHTHALPRVICDAVFQVILREDGMPRRKAKILSYFVRQCGKRSYMKGPSKLIERSPHLADRINVTSIIE